MDTHRQVHWGVCRIRTDLHEKGFAGLCVAMWRWRWDAPLAL